ncbi:MAG: hypothetical protein ACTSWN_16380 [Promethearchaeota archaeon]
MASIMKKIKIFPEFGSKNKIDVNAIFDTGSERSYVKRSFLPDGTNCIKIKNFSVNLGGRRHVIKERCTLVADIDGLGFDFSAHPIVEIGKVEKMDIGLIIGTSAMEEWDMVIDPKGQRIDLDGLKRREFLEL